MFLVETCGPLPFLRGPASGDKGAGPYRVRILDRSFGKNPSLAALMSDWTPDELEEETVFASLGPGSFTGTRVTQVFLATLIAAGSRTRIFTATTNQFFRSFLRLETAAFPAPGGGFFAGDGIYAGKVGGSHIVTAEDIQSALERNPDPEIPTNAVRIEKLSDLKPHYQGSRE